MEFLQSMVLKVSENRVRLGLESKFKDIKANSSNFSQKISLALKSYDFSTPERTSQKKVVGPYSALRRHNLLFDVPKQGAGKRQILELSHLNKYIPNQSFKMLTPNILRNIIPENSWTTSIDLQDAFWHIPIASNRIPFRVRGKYVFTAMPFGLSIAPRIFTKLMTIALLPLN